MKVTLKNEELRLVERHSCLVVVNVCTIDVEIKFVCRKKEKRTTRDSRAVERKKYGRKKARRSFQFSKR